MQETKAREDASATVIKDLETKIMDEFIHYKTHDERINRIRDPAIKRPFMICTATVADTNPKQCSSTIAVTLDSNLQEEEYPVNSLIHAPDPDLMFQFPRRVRNVRFFREDRREKVAYSKKEALEGLLEVIRGYNKQDEFERMRNNTTWIVEYF